MKKLLVILLAVSLLAVCAVSVNAADATGQCGENLTWTLNGNTLTISGTGPMYDYSEENPAPWAQISARISLTKIEDGVTSIGAYAFAHEKTSKAWISASVRTVGHKAFANEVNVFLYFLGQAPEFAEDVFSEGYITIYAVGWEDSVKQNYGGQAIWHEAELSLDAVNSKQLIGLNEALKPEDIVFKVYEKDRREYLDYTPGEVTFSPADNSTYGEKNITVTVDTHTFDFTYFVTDGTNHLDLINIEFDEILCYSGINQISAPTVKMGNMTLIDGVHYSSTARKIIVGIDGRVTIKGTGIAEGFEKTFYFPVLKEDISEPHMLWADDIAFNGQPRSPRVYVNTTYNLEEGVEFQALYQNNINIGTANARAVGINNCYGEAPTTFEITSDYTQVALSGNCIGTIDGELSNDILVSERVIRPAEAKINISTREVHIAAYVLYRVDGEEPIIVEEKLTNAGKWYDTMFVYDFSSVYEDDADKGGAIYLLSYSWVTEEEKVYAGAIYLIIPAKVPDATSMTMEHVENDGDFRKEYFNLCGDDGALGEITWTSSNPSVAVVENGTVTMKKPGITTISGQYGDMVETYVLTAPQLDLTEGIIFDYSEENGARVIYDNRLLTQGTDYILSVTKDGDAVTVTATGCGLFAGELMKTFDGLDSLADPHTHSFDNSCDGTCNGCDFTRSNDHNFAETWTKNETDHWHACTACGEKADQAQHTLSAGDATLCAVCGPLYTPGDVNGDTTVDEDDAIHLLQHILLPDYFTVNQAVDYTGDNRVDEDDAIYLLQHILLPEFFPL